MITDLFQNWHLSFCEYIDCKDLRFIKVLSQDSLLVRHMICCIIANIMKYASAYT